MSGCACGNKVQCCGDHQESGRPLVELIEALALLKYDGCASVKQYDLYHSLPEDIRALYPWSEFRKIPLTEKLPENPAKAARVPEAFCLAICEAMENMPQDNVAEEMSALPAGSMFAQLLVHAQTSKPKGKTGLKKIGEEKVVPAEPTYVADTSCLTPELTKRIQGNSDNNLYYEFSNVFLKGERRTKFGRDKIGAILPSELQSAFKAATSGSKRLDNNEINRRLIEVIRDEIYGILPDYNALATSEHVKPLTILGKTPRIFMDKRVANGQVNQLLNGGGVSSSVLYSAALKAFSRSFTSAEIEHVVHMNKSMAKPRVLVAGILALGEELAQRPK